MSQNGLTYFKYLAALDPKFVTILRHYTFKF